MSEAPKTTGLDKSRALEVIRHLNSNQGSGPIDRIIHERLRLGIVSALAVNPALTFSALRDILSTTDGNLSVHARKLEKAGYIICRKYFAGRTARTEYSLTEEGRQALENYLDHMESLVQAVRHP